MKKWEVSITIKGKQIFLGRYTNKLGAAKARYNAEVKYNWAPCNAFKSSAHCYIQNYV